MLLAALVMMPCRAPASSFAVIPRLLADDVLTIVLNVRDLGPLH